MGRLVRLELENFKSYKGHQMIGPFHNFTSVIGPNGAGKSNLMDAISFVLGVRSLHLRSMHLKDLVYRGAGDQEESDKLADPTNFPQKAYVMAVYEDDNGEEIIFKRTISISGSSEYRINNIVVSFNQYNEALERENILVKARNFLVFQGDVEAIASQSPKDLTKLIEQISGSWEYREEYEKLRIELERATENSTFNLNKKRGIHAEIKQYQEQKNEAERFEQMQKERAKVLVEYLLWKLFHIEKNIKSHQNQINENNEKIQLTQEKLNNADNALKTARRKHADKSRDILKLEDKTRKKERQLENKWPQHLELEEKIAHINKRLKRSRNNAEQLQQEYQHQESHIEALQTELRNVERALQQTEESFQSIFIKKGISLSESDLAEYNKLKQEVNLKTVDKQQQLANLRRQDNITRESLLRISERLNEKERQKAQLEDEEKSLNARKKKTEDYIKQLSEDLQAAQKSLQDLVTERENIQKMEKYLNNELQQTLNKLLQARVDQHESEKRQRMKETLDNLRRIYPGIHGRVKDLCTPNLQKYNVAVSVVLGRNWDAIIVDTEKTAIECIRYLREQRAGHATFIPLDTISTKPIHPKYRNFVKGAWLAIDIISYDTSLQRAMEYICGNTLVCETMEIAKYICYDRKEQVKAVTLDGTVIHKSGLITGGEVPNRDAVRAWEDKSVEELKRKREELLSKLNELSKSKRRGNAEEALQNEINGYRSRIDYSREDLDITQRKLDSIKDELKHVTEEIKELSNQHAEAKSKVEIIEEQIQTLESTIHQVEDEVFSDFCRKINVQNIREYEELQIDAANTRVRYATQQSKLQNQIDFEKQQLKEIGDRISSLNEHLTKDESLLAAFEKSRNKLGGEIDKIKEEIKALHDEQKTMSDTLAELAVEVENRKKEAMEVSKDLDKLMKEVARAESVIERLNAERFSIFRKCKLEEIKLPLKKGNLEAISIERAEAIFGEDEDAMEVDTEERAAEALGFGEIEVDFSRLGADKQRDDRGGEIEIEFQNRIKNITTELERMAPNLNANNRLNEVERRLRATKDDFEVAKRRATTAKEKFNAIRDERYRLFYDAFSHISQKIDQIYKELTKSKVFPLGGTAYLSLGDSEEPYLDGIKYHAMPPMKRFRDMEQLSGGEKTIAALALLFAFHSYKPAPFFVLDEVDAALDNANVARIANYIRNQAGEQYQFIVISLKAALYEKAEALVGIYRDQDINSSKTLSLRLDAYPDH
ncbi:uncharacterized protein VTP21DRAFT_10684 [Calcarisporiella thermophila]|uniref:uncharacterized protein n=1 Tax=Calcarisporiella thermophila TaxID=911321 RepID=UPI003742A22F